MSGANLLVLGGTQAAVDTSVYVEDVFSTYLYTGNGSNQTITNNINLSGKDGLIWWKARSSVSSNLFQDTVRGITKVIRSNDTGAQTTETTYVTSVSTTGFDVGTSLSVNNTTYATWTFREQPKFFDIVTYTGNGSNRTIAHNLGSVPGCIIVKRTDSATFWAVYHRSLGNTKVIFLNDTDVAATSSLYWNNTTPTSTEFTVGTDSGVNANGGTYVAYLFAHDAGGFGLTGSDNVISCGSFTPSGGVATVNLGFEPQWILSKTNSTGYFWRIVDNMRGIPVSPAGSNSAKVLYPNSSNAEASSGDISPTATGFTVNGQPDFETIYIAIRRGPMKTPTSGTSVFYPKVHAGTSSYSVGFPTDLCLAADQSGNALNTVAVYRLAGNNAYFGGTASTAAEVSVSVCQFDLQNSFQLSYNNNNQARWHFQRAPGFFDVVCYTGTGANRTVSHNLGVAPELMIVKSRNNITNWVVYTPTTGAADTLLLNTNDAEINGTTIWNSTSPTSSVFSVGTSNNTNENTYTYVAYLFASLSGVSKVGSYTGTGTTLQVNCGFTNGSRFVLIKRTDSTGDWYVWDSARGIVAGNDPYLLLNSTAAEVTNTDYVDTYSAGFEISSTAPAAINANGGTFIFLAIA